MTFYIGGMVGLLLGFILWARDSLASTRPMPLLSAACAWRPHADGGWFIAFACWSGWLTALRELRAHCRRGGAATEPNRVGGIARRRARFMGMVAPR